MFNFDEVQFNHVFLLQTVLLVSDECFSKPEIQIFSCEFQSTVALSFTCKSVIPFELLAHVQPEPWAGTLAELIIITVVTAVLFGRFFGIFYLDHYVYLQK